MAGWRRGREWSDRCTADAGDKASLIQDAGEDRIGTGDQVLRFGRVFHVSRRVRKFGSELCRRVLDILLKKTTSDSMTYLNQDEVKTLLAAPSTRHRLGLRDRALLTLLCNTGARATEIVQLNIDGLRLETPAQVRILGKGRKERVCPLWQETADALRAYPRQRADGTQPDAPLFLNAHGKRITRFGVGTILKRNIAVAATTLASLAAKPVSPHTLRHYVDGWVMWLAAESPLVAEPRVPVPAT